HAAFDAMPDEAKALRDAVPRLTALVPHLAGFTRTNQGEGCVCGALLQAGLAFDRAAPGAAPDWLAWVLNLVARRAKTVAQTIEDAEHVSLALDIAAPLASGDRGRFQTLLRAFLGHTVPSDPWYAPRCL